MKVATPEDLHAFGAGRSILLDGRRFKFLDGDWCQVGETEELFEVWWCRGGLLHVSRSRDSRTLCGCSTDPRAVYVAAEGEVAGRVSRNWVRAPLEVVYPWAAGKRCWKCVRALLARLGVETERGKA